MDDFSSSSADFGGGGGVGDFGGGDAGSFDSASWGGAVSDSLSGTTPTDTAPTDTAPIDTAPIDPAPIDIAPIDPAPIDIAPIDPAPIDTTPIDTAPIDPAPTDIAPINPAPIDIAPIDTTPIDTAPVDPAPVDIAPVDIAPVDIAPVDTTLSDTAPVDTPPVDTAPVDTAPVDTAPVDTAPVDTAPAAPVDTAPVAGDPATDTLPADPATTSVIAPTDAGNASDLVAAATDPASGQVNTQQLAQQIADAYSQNPDQAAAAYNAVHAQLQQSDPSLSQQLDGDVARAVGDVTSGAAAGSTIAGGQVLTDNPILNKTWVSTESAWTGKGGFTNGLQDLLTQNGIQVDPTVRPSPAGSLGPTDGVPSAQANNINGSLARDAIASEYAGQGYNVQTEVPNADGSRVVDVQVDQPASDPRYSQQTDVESKVGRTGLDSDIRAQVAKDGEALAANGEVRALGGLAESAGKVLGPVAVVADAVQLGQAFHDDGNTVGVNTGRTASGIAGGWGGAVAGAEGGAALGAAVGSVVPGVGTAIGGVVGGVAGGIAGAIGGDWAGRRVFDSIRNWF